MAEHGGGGEVWISTSPPWLHRIAMPLLSQNTGVVMKSYFAVDYRAWPCLRAFPKSTQSIASAASDATMQSWDDDQHRQPR